MGHPRFFRFWGSGLTATGLLGAALGLSGCGDSSREDVGSSTAPLCSGTVLTGNPPGPSDPGTQVTLTAQNASCPAGKRQSTDSTSSEKDRRTHTQ